MKKKASRRLVAAFTLAAMLVTLMPSGAAFAAPAEEAGEATKVETTQQRASSPAIPEDAIPITIQNRNLTTGNYVLEDDVVLDAKQYDVTGEVNIYLNGHRISKNQTTNSGGWYNLKGNTHLTIYGPGTIGSNFSINGWGDAHNASLTLKGVVLGDASKYTHWNWSGVFLDAVEIIDSEVNVSFDTDFNNEGTINIINSEINAALTGDYIQAKNSVINGSLKASSSISIDSSNADSFDKIESPRINIKDSQLNASYENSSNKNILSIGDPNHNSTIEIDSSTISTVGRIGDDDDVISITSGSVVGAKQIGNHRDMNQWNGIISENNEGAIYGDVLLRNMTIPHGMTVNIPQEQTISFSGKTLTVDGKLNVYGKLNGPGIIDGRGDYYVGEIGSIDSTIQNKLRETLNMTFEPIIDGRLGDAINLTVRLKKASGGNVTDGKVAFEKDGKFIGRVPVRNGVAIFPIELNSPEWTVGRSYTLTANYESADNQLGAQTSQVIRLGLGKQVAPPVPVVDSKTKNSITLKTIPNSAQSGVEAEYGIKEQDGNIKWQKSNSFYYLEANKSYSFYTKYPMGNGFYESAISGPTIIQTDNLKIQKQPPAPTIENIFGNNVVLAYVESPYGTDVQYGIKENGSIRWQDHPEFYNLQSGEKYSFYVKYLGNDTYQPSPNSLALDVTVASLKPIIRDLGGGVTTVTPMVPTVGERVKIYLKPHNGSVVKKVVVKERNGDEVFLKEESSLVYSFKQPETQVTVEVTYGKENDLSPIITPNINGKIHITPSVPEVGQKIIVNIVPNKGYLVEEVVVTDARNRDVKISKRTEGEYVFTQPDTQVVIEVVYKKIPLPELPPSDNWNNPFIDVPKGAWYHDAVRYVYENGLMVGLAPNNFGANVTTDRGQLVTMLWRMAGEPQATNGTDFSDVPSNAYYANAVAWAAENGITAGFEDGSFRPQTGLSREQMAALFMKYAEATGVDTSVRADISSYTDINPNSWSYDALSWAKAVGLLSGVSENTMAPQVTATRVQIAAVIQRYCETVKS